MNLKRTLSLLFLFAFQLVILGQTETYTVSKASLSSEKYDEFCPVYYKGGIVFCSNRSSAMISKYSNTDDRGFFKIFYIDLTAKDWKDAKLFSKDLTTKLNDGPVSFSKDQNVIYYSRNLLIDGKLSEISGPRNKLGVFSSRAEGDGWKMSREMRFNNEWYNITSPCLSPDGSRLFFASDKSGGYGGSDIYYCSRENDYWGDPVNLGPKINTAGNEAYPFMCRDDELYFSSDGLPGLGGKDIFFSKYADSIWLDPIHIEAPINSKADDFGLVTDQAMSNGYFSSNRDGSFDIFSFATNIPQFFYCLPQKLNQYCFSFKDVGGLEIDGLNLQYEWDFGDSGNSLGTDVNHCFSGPGRYFVRENLIDRQNGSNVFLKQSFDIEIKEIEQPFITSDDYAVTGQPMNFTGLKSFMPGYELVKFYWDFGDGTRGNGSTISHTFKSAGNFNVKMGLLLKDLSTGDLLISSVYKTIKVFNDQMEKNSYLSYIKKDAVTFMPVGQCENVIVHESYNAKEEIEKKALFNVVILSSKSRLKNIDETFSILRGRYSIKEVYLQNSDTYCYVVAEETEFVDAYLTLSGLRTFGFNDAFIQIRRLTDPDEKELNNLENVYGNYSELFFIKNEARITSNGFALLDQMVILLNKYPGIKILIESHADRASTPALNLQLTEQRARNMANYLINRGIDYRRVVPVGYGDTRPLSLSRTEEGRKKNQRIDFMIIK